MTAAPTPIPGPGRVVVGVDGSEHARGALTWAAAEAEARELVLVPVLAWTFLDQPGDDPFRPDFGPDDARRYLDGEVAEVLGDAPAVTLDPAVVTDTATHGVLSQVHGAELLVVGERGRGRFGRRRLGSVSHALVQESPVPVVVHRPGAGGHGRVVVGVDGSENSRAALAWAATHARGRGSALVVVQTWTSPVVAVPEGVVFDPAVVEAVRSATGRDLSALVADVLGDHDGLEVEQVVEEGPAGPALIDRAAEADLVVVGTRGRGGFAALVLGSVSSQVLAHAPGPVAVVPLPPPV